MVEYVATFTLFKPIDLAKVSDVMLYEVVNRGIKSDQELNGSISDIRICIVVGRVI
jgi:hypothetical protein